jgi:hypothetical protein
MILTIVVKKMIKRCQASALKPSGVGINHISSAADNTTSDKKSFDCKYFI